MRKVKTKTVIFCTGLLLVSFTGLCAKQKVIKNLHTQFSNVLLSGMKPGMIYSLKNDGKLPYKVVNGSDKAVNVIVEISIPRTDQLKEGYEQLPDENWIKVTPNRMKLGPGEATDCDILIAIPEGMEYENRNFRANVVTKTERGTDNKGGIFISFSLSSILRFSTGKTPEELVEEFRTSVLESLNLELAPFSIYLNDITPGETVLLDGIDIDTLQVVNKSKKDYKLSFRTADSADKYGISTGYESATDSKWLTFKKKKIRSKNRTINDVLMKLKIPDKEENRGKKFAFIVIARLEDYDIPIEIHSRVYVKTKK